MLAPPECCTARLSSSSVRAGELAEQLQTGTGVFGSPGSMDDGDLDDALLNAAAEAAGDTPAKAPRGRGKGSRGGR